MTTPDFAALWDAVYEQPADLAPRWVLADAYSSVGNPRGAFMAASLHALTTGQRPRGEVARLREHEREWLGHFGGLTQPPRVWRGGVLAGCRTLAVPPQAHDFREWRLIEELYLTMPQLGVDLPPSAFPSLRVLGVISLQDLRRLARAPIGPQLERVYVDLPGRPPDGELSALVEWPHRSALEVVCPPGRCPPFPMDMGMKYAIGIATFAFPARRGELWPEPVNLWRRRQAGLPPR